MSDNFLSQLSNEEVIYITLLMGMYEDNVRQIETLTNSNNMIRDALLETVRRIGRTRDSRNSVLNEASPPSNTNVLNETSPPPNTSVLNEAPQTPTTPPRSTILGSSSPITYTTPPLNTSFYSMFSHRLTPPQAPVHRRNYNRNLNRTSNRERLQTYFIPSWSQTTNYFDMSGNDIFSNMPDYGRIFETFFQPVNISPTSTQIENAVRQVRYGDILRPINNSCPISLETFNDNSVVSMIRHCGHIFNTDELSNWFNTNYRCPVCRYDIRSYNSNHSSNQSSELDSNVTQNN